MISLWVEVLPFNLALEIASLHLCHSYIFSLGARLGYLSRMCFCHPQWALSMPMFCGLAFARKIASDWHLIAHRPSLVLALLSSNLPKSGGNCSHWWDRTLEKASRVALGLLGGPPPHFLLQRVDAFFLASPGPTFPFLGALFIPLAAVSHPRRLAALAYQECARDRCGKIAPTGV